MGPVEREEPVDTVFVPIILGGLLSGGVAGVLMGIILHGGANLMPFIGALYGTPTVSAGWVVHMINSAVFGAIFAVLVVRTQLASRIEHATDYLIAGVTYGTLIGLFMVGVVLPFITRLLDVTEFPEPVLELNSFLGELLLVFSVGTAHIVYGLVLGVTFFILLRSDALSP